MNEAYIPAIITASVALLAAVGAQYLSHHFNNQRENKKRQDEIYQEFIYPFVSDVLFFYETSTAFREDHIDQKVDVNKLLNNISEKVSYGNMRLLSSYYEINKMNYYADYRGWSKESNTLVFLFWYLDYVIEILQQKNPKKDSMYKNIIRTQKLYAIWYLVADEIGYPLSIEFMKYDFYLYENFLPEIEIKVLRDLVNSNRVNYRQRRFNFLKMVIREFERKEENDHSYPGLQELKEHIERNKIIASN